MFILLLASCLYRYDEAFAVSSYLKLTYSKKCQIVDFLPKCRVEEGVGGVPKRCRETSSTCVPSKRTTIQVFSMSSSITRKSAK